jgi:hypothetical protein
MNGQEQNDGSTEPRDERPRMTYRSDPFEVPSKAQGSESETRESAEGGYGWGV